LRDNILLIFSGGKNDLIIETAKIITASKIKIFIVSKIKKFTASPASEPFSRLNKSYVNKLANSCIG
jgi:hypothetical protein